MLSGRQSDSVLYSQRQMYSILSCICPLSVLKTTTNLHNKRLHFITARIRSMTGRYCFHRCLSVNISGGGDLVSDFRGGGGRTWSQIFRGGGYLFSDFRGGGVPGLRKLLWLHGGRYASCVHAGGLSCWG